jgi:hypothetical protein
MTGRAPRLWQGRHRPLLIVGMGALYLLMPLSMFFNRSLRQMDTERRGETTSSAIAE